jgi:hypothetical protein
MPVEVKGVNEMRRALAKFSPDLYKAVNSEIRPELAGMARDAKNLVPGSFLSGSMNEGQERKSRTSRSRAFPIYDSTTIRRGLTYSMGRKRGTRSGWSSLYSLLNKSAMGSIIETAGRLFPNGSPYSQSNNPQAGRQFIDAANQISSMKSFGKGRKNQGRLAYAAASNNQGKALAAIMDALQRAQKMFEARTK